MEIWFWTDIVSPHQVGLYRALREAGHEVKLFVQSSAAADRLQLGWNTRHDSVDFVVLRSRRHVRELVMKAPSGAVHICSGLHGRSGMGQARRELARRGIAHWAMLEKVDDSGVRGPFKRLRYRMLLHRWRDTLGGILAIGGGTREWLIARGADPARVFPFAYFLDPPPGFAAPAARPFTICYLGKLTSRKRVDLLVAALGSLGTKVRLLIVGPGECEASLRRLAARQRSLETIFSPSIPHGQVYSLLASVDLLVLPSAFDGWGAVISEALLAGTPVICSDACGAHVVVEASGAGWVYPAGDLAALRDRLERAIGAGRLSNEARRSLAEWGRMSLSGAAGARYLGEILGCRNAAALSPPWLRLPPALALASIDDGGC